MLIKWAPCDRFSVTWEVSKPCDLCLELFYNSESWQASRHHCCETISRLDESVTKTLQWNRYKATNDVCSLSRQVVFHDRELKRNFVKTGPGKWSNSYVLLRLPRYYYAGSTVFFSTVAGIYMVVAPFVISRGISSYTIWTISKQLSCV